MCDIKTFVFLDLETTGLPHLEGNRTKITELCLIAVQANHLRLGVFPRVQNKLNFCFNPWKRISDDAERTTGLSNHLLEHLSKFSVETVQAINIYLNHNPKPICLVAHNGNGFDFPILRKEIEKTGINLLDGVYCVDSLRAFREIYKIDPKATQEQSNCSSDSLPEPVPVEFSDGFDEILCNTVEEFENSQKKMLYIQKLNETTPKKQTIASTLSTNISSNLSKSPACKKLKTEPAIQPVYSGVSFKLCDIYERLTAQKAKDSHQAEADVNMLLSCVAIMGDKFMNWANLNGKYFCDIPPMVPGKKIGT